jgi:hypothetical protein
MVCGEQLKPANEVVAGPVRVILEVWLVLFRVAVTVAAAPD